MTSQEQENFYRHSTAIVDETKDSFLQLLDFYLTKEKITLRRFIEINEHEIHHMCYNRYPCCQCPTYIRSETRGSRVLQQQQLDILIDPGGEKLSVHNPRSKSAPHCCSPVNPHLQLLHLDFTLARLLLVSFTSIVQNGSVERNALDSLVKIRNESFAHAKEGRIPNDEYQSSMVEIEKSLLILARIYSKEAETKQRLKDIAKQPLNSSICLQLQNTLLQQCQIEEAIKQLLAEKTLPDCLTRDLCDITVTEGCDAHFEIWTKEYRLCVIWFEDEVEIVRSEKFIPEKSGKIHSLIIRNTCLSDKGFYTVRLKDLERQACLNVEEYFTMNLQSVKCIEGETAEFTCEVIEDRLPAYWTKDGQNLKNNEKYQMFQSGKLHRLFIKHCDLHDAANYSVSINNRVRETSLVVIEYFTKPLGTMIYIEGETVQFECEVLDDNQTVMWYKDGTEVNALDRYKVERHGKLYRLVVSNAKFYDQGKYSVKIKNCFRHSQLFVQEMPTAIQHLSEEDKALYLDIIKTGTELRYYIRIAIIGENGVGKTCLLRRLLKQSITGVQSTDGIDIHRCKICLGDGKWIFTEVSDKKKELLTRLKRAVHSNLVEDTTLQEKPYILNASELHDDRCQKSNRGSPDTNSSFRQKKKQNIIPKQIKSKLKRTISQDQSFTTSLNLPEVSEVTNENRFQQTHSKTIAHLLDEHVLQGLDDLLNGIEKVNIQADRFVECGILILLERRITMPLTQYSSIQMHYIF